MAKAKEIENLECAASVLAEIKRVALVRLEEIETLRGAALDFSDIEGVHDMRVATRRLRSLLRDFNSYFTKKVSTKKLKTLADALGTVRDADVQISALEKLAAHEDETIAAGIMDFVRERTEQRTEARKQLESAIDEETFAASQERFVAQLERATEPTHGKRAGKIAKANQSISFREAIREIVLARFVELEDESRSLYHPFEMEPLHRMRIAAKRLRYAIELGAECYGKSLVPFAQSVSDMQTFLGELHDCDVWIEEWSARLEAQSSARRHATREKHFDATHHAMEKQAAAAVWLLRFFVKERTAHYRAALALWHEWETTNFHTRLVNELSQTDQLLNRDLSSLEAAEDS